jgi:uncharacterized repeat protein (TIGR03803 family)
MSKPKLSYVPFVLLIAAVAANTAIPVAAQTFTLLHTFAGSDGTQPVGSLVQTTIGAFYGTASAGGFYDGGTIYKIDPDGTFTTVYNFSGPDGLQPGSALIQGTDGNLYGTTFAGGNDGLGTVFKMTLVGALTTLHKFSGGEDGANPFGGVVEGSNGLFYGTTEAGTAYAIAPDGKFAPIQLPVSDPQAALIQASDGGLSCHKARDFSLIAASA